MFSSQLLRLATDSVDRAYLRTADLRLWADSDGKVDLNRVLTAMGATSYLFSDLSALSNVDTPYERFTWATSVLDKAANLLAATASVGKKEGYLKKLEGELFKNLASRKAAQWAADTLDTVCSQKNLYELAKVLPASVIELHFRLMVQLGTASYNEETCLDRLRAFRNLRHGAFLGQGQFDALYLDAGLQDTAPMALPAYVWLLVHALLADFSSAVEQFCPRS